MDYVQYSLSPIPFEPWNEILVAELSEIGFESFMEEEKIVLAYIPESSENSVAIESILDGFKTKNDLVFTWSRKNIKHQNWNAVWESNFEPVFIENSLSIVAPFHDASSRKNRVIEIDPKMSFGTGHHQTTFLMCKEILSLALEGKSILDMGTGTGVLAILAEHLGAKQCIAIDIESWSVENTKSNALRNGCTKIIALEGGVSKIPSMQFDYIFANINKNVLKEQMKTYALNLKPDGILLLSGFFITDVDELVLFANKLGLAKVGIREKENWALIKLEKTTMV
mgnify:CR=1 FL=1